jgi:cell division protease FtsH
MDDEDKRIIAYHEAGHAIVQAIIDDGRLPLHKVTIIPRGQALGMAMMMPKKDILNQSRSFLLNRVCTAMGGRIAEDLVFGDVTSGASSDIKGATKIARHMVCDFGMSTLGPVAYGENQDHIFLGREIARDQNYSEQTAREIDAAIRRIVDEQYERAKGIIIQHRTALDKLAELLLKHETLEGKHVHEIIESGDIRSPVAVHPRQSPETLEEADQKQKDKERKKRKSEEGLSPGTEPAIA